MRKRLPRWGYLSGGLGLILILTASVVCWPRKAPPPNDDPPKTADLPLEEAERQYLWEIEHHGQLLSQRGFPAVAAALREADAPALRKLLATDFQGAMMRDPLEVRLPGDCAQVVRLEDQGNPPELLGGDEFVSRLLAYRSEFGPPPKVQISLMTLSPLTRQDLDGLWQGKCVLRMWGEAAPGSPAEVVLSLTYRVPRPGEELFKKPGWLRGGAITQSLVGKSPRPLLREVAAERGIDVTGLHDNWNASWRVTTPGGVFLCDYDRDGILDMLITDVNGCTLYKGLPGGKFKPVPLHLAPGAYNPVVFADLDGDGWDDLLVGSHIYRNQPDGKGGRRFVDVTSRTNLRIDESNTTAAVVADYDRDGRLDIFVTRRSKGKAGSWATGRAGDDTEDRLWRNKGNWQFEDVTAASGVAGGDSSSFSAVWLDADNDGWPDLYVINEFGNGRLLMNKGDGTFRATRLTDGPGDFGSMGVAAGDIDNDGNIDLYVANMYSKAGSRVIGNLRPDAYPAELMHTIRHFVTGSQLWLKRGKKFEPRGQSWQVAAVGWTYGPALVDLDNDGFLDIYATAGFMSHSRDEPDG